MTLDVHTLDSDGQSTKSKLTTESFFHRIREYDNKELTKQLTQRFVRLIDQPNLKFQLSFYFHFEKKTDNEYEKDDHYNRLKKKHVRTQLELESSINEVDNELDKNLKT